MIGLGFVATTLALYALCQLLYWLGGGEDAP